MPDEFPYAELGFDSMEEFFHMVSSVDLSTPTAIAAFKKWQESDGTKKGLLALKNN